MDENYYGNICYCRRCNGVVHTIKKGDTLYLISKYYKVPIGEIMSANRNINIYNLQIGDEICIPVRRPMPVPPENGMMSETDNEINNAMGNEMENGTTNEINNNTNGEMENEVRNSNSGYIEDEYEDTVNNEREVTASTSDTAKTMKDISNMTLAEFASFIRNFDK